MTNKELRKLSRENLLEIMVEQQRRIESLEDQVEELTETLRDRRIAISESGSIAEAAIQLSHVFEAAQMAADTYLENVRVQSRRMKNDYDEFGTDLPRRRRTPGRRTGA
jgi:cell division septum initiation protein DivIVA